MFLQASHLAPWIECNSIQRLPSSIFCRCKLAVECNELNWSRNFDRKWPARNYESDCNLASTTQHNQSFCFECSFILQRIEPSSHSNQMRPQICAPKKQLDSFILAWQTSSFWCFNERDLQETCVVFNGKS